MSASPQVVVVGGGPAGLAAAVELRSRGIDVLVLDREQELGGIPRHSVHQGFGLRDLRRSLSGPRYAERYTRLARAAGARVVAEATVTGWSGSDSLEVTSPEGCERVSAQAVLLATGCRERPRSARLVPGSRPEGVLTTGMLQQLVYLQGRRIGTRALIVGAEHVSFSALLTIAHGGARAVGMVTELPRHQSLALVSLGARMRYRTPLWTRTAVTAIHGFPRVEEVELMDIDTGGTRRVACDTVVFTADWIPDHELAVVAGVELDAGTRGPVVDTGLRTSRTGVLACGNLLHGAEPADVAALSGRHAARTAARYLADDTWPELRVSVLCEPPLSWIAPNALSETRDIPPRSRFVLRSEEFLDKPLIEIRQDGILVWSGRLRRLIPGRSGRLPYEWIDSCDPKAGPAYVRVASTDPAV